MKKYILIYFALASVSWTFAQQDFNYTLNYFHPNLINPAVVGKQDVREINLSYRSQWMGVPDAPKTFGFSVAVPTNSFGFGLSVVKDKVFVLDQTTVGIDLSYMVQINEKNRLFFGVKGGGSFFDIRLTDAVEESIDPLFKTDQSFFNPQIGAGMYWQGENYFMSLSVPNFLRKTRYEKQGNNPVQAMDAMHFYLGGGFVFQMSEILDYTPSLLYRYVDGAPSSLDIVQTLTINEKHDVGLQYRFDETVALFGMLAINESVRIGVAYDYPIVKFDNTLDNSSVEILLKYEW
ncbi:MAG: PorP/SprF family type IX secretion system membrane protein [Flavobacteriaceae bacterium]|nr:PorP/SprF family type IX secretion system membrane protein [Flavobacteriaceae bacterium]